MTERLSTAQRLELWLLRGVLALLRRLGPVRASNLGGATARAVGPLLPVSRVAHDNLRRAMPELDAAARRRIVRGVWDNLGRTFAELPHLASLERNAAGPGWELTGEEHMLATAAQGGAAIFFSGHIGNWEMLPRVVAAYGMKMSSVYRAPSNPRVEALLTELRRTAIGHPVPMFPKGAAGARAAFAHMMRGGTLGLLMDQKLNDGIAVPFFGREAMTSPALASLALRFRCPVIPGRAVRVGPARFLMIAEAPLALPDSGDRNADIEAVTRDMNAHLERWIRERPESWLWLHRRWPKGS